MTNNGIFTIRPKQIKHEILKLLASVSHMRTEDIFERCKYCVSGANRKAFKITHLYPLKDNTLIYFDSVVGAWTIAPLGLRKLKELDSVVALSKPDPALVVRNNLHKPSGTYDGKELQRNCGREGAYTAYDLPSRGISKV